MKSFTVSVHRAVVWKARVVPRTTSKAHSKERRMGHVATAVAVISVKSSGKQWKAMESNESIGKQC